MDEALQIVLDAARRLAGPDADLGGDPFLPTGHLQDQAIDEGWGDAFLALANRWDCAVAGRAAHLCGLCGAVAATLTCEDGTVRRESFTSVLTQGVTPTIRAAIGDAAALYAVDRELASFYCPACEVAYCGEHWQTWSVFDDDGWHDSIRGLCPEDHERMIED